MHTNRPKTTSPYKDIARVFATTAAILLLPLIAMQFTREVNWDVFDFVVMGVLLSSTGLLCVLAMHTIKDSRYRIIAVVALLALLLLIWAELSVGIIGSPFAGS